MKRRVVVTGIGAVTPLGLTAGETWRAVIEGRSGVKKITLFDTTDCPVQIAAEVKGFDPSNTQIVNPKDIKRMARFIQLAMSAGMEAYADSGLDKHRSQIASERMGVNISVGMGGLPEIENLHKVLLEKGYRRITPFFIPQVIPNLAAGQLSALLNLKGPNLCISTACASSAHGIGESFHSIQRGDTDVMFSGGAEAVISPLGIGGFAAMRALSVRNNEPEKASRPFDIDRDGFVMGEGAAVLVLEEFEHAAKRGAIIYAELLGYGLSADAYHITLPAPGGEGGVRSMAMALKKAGLQHEQIGYINAHGTSTPAGDTEELQAIAKLFYNSKKHLHVSATKSITGHLLGAAGAVEAMFTLLAVKEGKIPPTINLDHPDPKCAELELDLTPHKFVQKKVDYALSNSFGFGGTNASLVFGRV